MLGVPPGMVASVGGHVVGALGSGLEQVIQGPGIVGAQTAQLQYATHRIDPDFDDSGSRYLRENEQLARELALTKAQVTQQADALSKLGYGFFEPQTQGMIRFAKSMETYLNLHPGQVMDQLTLSVRDYGESLDAVATSDAALIQTQQTLVAAYGQTKNASLLALSAQAGLAEAMTQVDQAAVGTGASLETVNTAFLHFLTSAASGDALGRPTMVRQGAAGAIQALFPNATYTMGAPVAAAGSTYAMLFRLLPEGQKLLADSEKYANAHHFTTSKETTEGRTYSWLPAVLRERMATEPGVDQQVLMATMLGLDRAQKSGQFGTSPSYVLGGLLQLTGHDVDDRTLNTLMRVLGSLPQGGDPHAFFSAPEGPVADALKAVRGQLTASQSIEERMAKHLSDIATIFGAGWWDHFKNTLRDVFGLDHERGAGRTIPSTPAYDVTAQDIDREADRYYATSPAGVSDIFPSSPAASWDFFPSVTTMTPQALMSHQKEQYRHQGLVEHP
jgi:hypothetical protein